MDYTKLSLKDLYHLKDALKQGQKEVERQIDEVDNELANRQGERISQQLQQVFGLKEVIAYCGWCGAPLIEDKKFCPSDCAEHAHYDQLENMATGN